MMLALINPEFSMIHFLKPTLRNLYKYELSTLCNKLHQVPAGSSFAYNNAVLNLPNVGVTQTIKLFHYNLITVVLLLL